MTVYSVEKNIRNGLPYKFRCRLYGKYDEEFLNTSPNYTNKDDTDLTDYDGFGYVKSDKKLLNITRVGNPTITNDFVVSNFSASNYCTNYLELTDLSQPFQIYLRIKPTSSGTNKVFLSNQTKGSSPMRVDSGVLKMWSSSSGSIGTYALSNNSVYDIKGVSDGTTWYLYGKLAEEDEYTLSGSTSISNMFSSGSNSLIFGRNTSSYTGQFFSGEIDLKYCYILVGSQFFPDVWQKVWEGVTYQYTVLDFSQTILPWKWDFQKLLKKSAYVLDSDTVNEIYYGNTLNGTANGAIIIDPDKIMSGFSSSNYLTIGNTNLTTASSWEFVSKFKATTINKYQFFFQRPVAFGLDNTNHMHIWNLPMGDVYSDFTFSANTWYWVKFEFTGTEYNGYYKTAENDAWTRIINVPSTDKVSSTTTPTYIGLNPNNTSEYFYGYIDLKEAYISINGAEVWRGFEKKELQGCIASGGQTQNFSVEGSPTINNYTLSNFSDDDYAYIDTSYLVDGYTYIVKFTTGSDILTFQNILGIDLWWELYVDNQNLCAWIESEGHPISCGTVSENTTYWAKIVTDGNGLVTLSYSTDGTTFVGSTSESCSMVDDGPESFNFGRGFLDMYGRAFSGSIDMLNSSIYNSNNVKIWSGYTNSGGGTDPSGYYYCYAINGDDHIELIKKTGNTINTDATNPRYIGEVNAN